VKKVKVYRILGWLFLAIGIIFSFYGLVYIWDTLFFTGLLFVPVVLAGLNPFLWSGLIFLWRADKNSRPEKKSGWEIILVIFLVLSLLAIIGLIFNK